jgi:hypothetical protein
MSVVPSLNSVVIFYSTINGMSEASNIGCAFTKGIYIALLDDDITLCKN